MTMTECMHTSTAPRVLAAVALALSLAGCVSTDISDLEQWVQDVLARPGGIIDPLPPFKPYEAYAYKSAEAGARDPFVPFYASRSEEKAKVAGGSGLTKEQEWEMKDRSREELEQFELDSLRMVGTMKGEKENWGIIKDPSGVVHRVKIDLGKEPGAGLGPDRPVVEALGLPLDQYIADVEDDGATLCHGPVPCPGLRLAVRAGKGSADQRRGRGGCGTAPRRVSRQIR